MQAPTALQLTLVLYHAACARMLVPMIGRF